MMAQFLEIKARHQGALLFYRMGDFYELFFEDAVAAAEALDIALTKRGKHLGEDIPMCGVPFHAAEGYLLNLIRKGFRVAVCEQLEDPSEAKKRGAKSVVRRDVVRLVTPGTLTEESLLEARKHNFLACFAKVRSQCGLAWVDISTGSFRVAPISAARLGTELARVAPNELIVSEADEAEYADVVSESGVSVTNLGRASFDSTNGETRLCAFFDVGSLDAFGAFSRAEIAAMGALLQYLEITQKGNLPILRPPTRENESDVVQIDAATRRNLELTHSLTGGRSGSLLSVVDRTVTAAGGRLLEQRISNPSAVLEEIAGRLDAVDFAMDESSLFGDIRTALRKVPDLDRALSRISLGRGGPRDLAAIRDGLQQALDIYALLVAKDLPKNFGAAVINLEGHADIMSLLEKALVAEPPLLVRDGGFIATGYHSELDEARALRDEGRSVIAAMQNEYAKATGIAGLKIKHNNVLGYFIEVTAAHAEKMLSEPLNETFRHRQTTASQVRFTTPELSELETKILNAGGHALGLEKQFFEELRSHILACASEISHTSGALAETDVIAGLADLARGENWCRPKIDESRALAIQGGRHPVVEHALKSQGNGPFVANDCGLGGVSDIWLLTGPNMAGKSTFLRQNAIIALLAQIGSYVPASNAHIGLISQLFSRVGASDDLARGRSTFMVEMVETAAILNQADDRALVILDEIGRGTATYDGLSIAWATLEHLHEVNRCRALFATHYHEMTGLSAKLSRVENATVSVKEFDGDVIFLHEVHLGAADRSYGVQVAKLAGLPKSVIERARVVLDALEKGEREGNKSRAALIEDLPLFSVQASAPPATSGPSKLEERLAEISPDELSPREALDLIYLLKELAK